MPKIKGLKELSKEFRSLKSKRSSNNGGPEGRALESIAVYNDEQWCYLRHGRLLNPKPRKNHPHLVINRIKPRVRKQLGRLTSVEPVFRATPDAEDPSKIAMAEEVNRLIPALSQKVDDEEINWKLWWMLLVTGGAVEYTAFRPDVTVEPVPVLGPDGEVMWKDNLTGEEVTSEQRDMAITGNPEMGVEPAPAERFDIMQDMRLTGDVESEVLCAALQVFVDPSVTSIDKLGPGQRVYVATIRSREWIEQNFPGALDEETELDDDLSIIKTDISTAGAAFGGHDLKQLIPAIQGSKADDDDEMAVVLECFEPVSSLLPQGWSVQAASENPDLPFSVPTVQDEETGAEIPDLDNLFGGRYSVFIPEKKMLRDGEIPYEDGIPLVDFHYEPSALSFYTDGYVHGLKGVQKALNEDASHIRKHVRAWVQRKGLLGGELTENDFLQDEPHWITDAIDPETGNPLARMMEVADLPASFLRTTQDLEGAFNDIAGAADIFQEQRFPGQIRGSLAFPMLQEFLDSEHGPLIKHFWKRKAKVHAQRVNRVKQFYPPVRTLNYTTRSSTTEVLTFHTEQILRAGTDFNITVQPSSLTPELSMMREARIRERLESPLALLYMDESTGQIDKEMIAKELRFGDVSTETEALSKKKFALAVVDMIVSGKGDQAPPVLPFQPHDVFMKELEKVMNDMDFFNLSPEVQQQLVQRAQEHSQELQRRAEAQQQAMMQQQQQGIVNEAVQQASAQAAAQAREVIMEQIRMAISDPQTLQGMLAQAMQTSDGVQ